jgi:hypothetical protein
MNEINLYVMERFCEARDDFRIVQTNDIKQWGLLKASEYPNFQFKASDS